MSRFNDVSAQFHTDSATCNSTLRLPATQILLILLTSSKNFFSLSRHFVFFIISLSSLSFSPLCLSFFTLSAPLIHFPHCLSLIHFPHSLISLSVSLIFPSLSHHFPLCLSFSHCLSLFPLSCLSFIFLCLSLSHFPLCLSFIFPLSVSHSFSHCLSLINFPNSLSHFPHCLLISVIVLTVCLSNSFFTSLFLSLSLSHSPPPTLSLSFSNSHLFNIPLYFFY